MATNLNLIKYDLNMEGRYLEEKGEIITTSFISENVLNDIKEIAPFAVLKIFEEENSDEYSETDCFQNDKIPEIIALIQNKFIELIEQIELLKLQNNQEYIEESISTFRSITNLYYLLEIKFKKYVHDDSVIVKLG